MDPSRPVDIELLCAQAGWVRSLARHLVRDPAGAEDIAQETMLAALQAPPADVADVHRLRAWLRRVAFNLSRLSVRRSQRRRAREERVAQSDRLGSTADAVLRESIRVHLAEAVGSLEEPYRSTVELRYYEGASTSDIASRMGTTDNAVRKRLFRARNKLRRTLDTVHHGDRQAWFHALLPLAGPWVTAPAPPAGAATGAGPLSRTAAGLGKLAPAFGLGGLGLAAALFLASTPTRFDEPGIAAAEHVAALSTQSALGTPALADPDRVPARPEPPEEAPATSVERALERPPGAPPSERTSGRPAAPAVAAAPSLAFRGQVVDLGGRPVGGLALFAAERDEPLGWSAADGGFELTLSADAAGGRLTARDDAWSTLQGAALTPEQAGRELFVVVARAVAVGGTVVDADGRAVAGAGVRLVAQERAFLALERPLAEGLLAEVRATCDALGRFTLAGVPSGPGLSLEAFTAPDGRGPGRSSARAAVPPVDTADLRLCFEPEPLARLRVSGVVRFEDGAAASDTEVRLGERATRTDRQGRFGFELQALDPRERLVVRRRGFEQLSVPDLGTLFAASAEGPLASRSTGSPRTVAAAHVGLVLVETSGSLVGSVQTAEGAACAGWIVRAELARDDSGAFGGSGQATLESYDETSRPGTRTDAEGRFELRGLADRRHVLVAYDPETLVSTRSQPLAVGSLARLVVPPEAERLASVRGRVTDRGGAPIEGAEVCLALALDACHPGADTLAAHALSGVVRSDALGFFELSRVPAGVELAVRSAGQEVHLAVVDRDAELVVRLPRTVPLRVSTALAADSFALVDAAGNELALRGVGREPLRRGRLYAGRSILYATALEDAHALVFFEGGVEVARQPLRAGETPSPAR